MDNFKFHSIGAGLIVGAVILAINGLPLVAALSVYCAYIHAKGGKPA